MKPRSNPPQVKLHRHSTLNEDVPVLIKQLQFTDVGPWNLANHVVVDRAYSEDGM